MRVALVALGLATSAAGLGAQPPALIAEPARPEPGSIVRLTFRTRPGAADSIRELRGELAGEPLHFVSADSGRWRAIGAVPVDASRSVAALVVTARASGRSDTVRLRVPVAAVPPSSTEPLAVDTTFTQLDSAAVARVNRDNARARAIGRRAHDTPRLWAAAFLRPRASPMTGTFGTGRSFNRRVTSRHLGVDFQGRLGDTVRAANRGIVALVDTFLLAGTVVYLDHGAGVVTGYFHLSRPLVATGDTVARGQVIALVGASGRVTGAHLHWSARYGALTVNPLDLVGLGGWYGAGH